MLLLNCNHMVSNRHAEMMHSKSVALILCVLSGFAFLFGFCFECYSCFINTCSFFGAQLM